MTRFFRSFQTQLKGLLQIRVPLPTSPIGWVTACLTFLGFGGLCYLCGAAVLFFQLPSAAFLDNAFKGAKAWSERGRSTLSSSATDDDSQGKKQGISVDRAEKTWDGFTLYTATDGAQATFIDMKGTVVHRWELPFSQVWSHPPHVPNPLPDEQIHWFRCRLFPNGDVLAIYHADGDTPYGYGLVKLDKDSKLIWAYPNNVHHDVDEDGGMFIAPPGRQIPFQAREENHIGMESAFDTDVFHIFARGGFQISIGVVRDGQDVAAEPLGLADQLLNGMLAIGEFAMDVGIGFEPDAFSRPLDLADETRLCSRV